MTPTSTPDAPRPDNEPIRKLMMDLGITEAKLARAGAQRAGLTRNDEAL